MLEIDSQLLYQIAVALGIGLLVGLQREYAYSQYSGDDNHQGLFAGTRTFALLGLMGWLAAFSAETIQFPALFAAILIPILTLIIVAYVISSRQGDIGMTTEVSAAITFLIGALCFWQYITLAIALGVVTMVLLSLKLELQQFATRLSQDDIVATLKFAVITAIILPILPTTPLGPPPFDVLNLRNIWLMVVLISGISFLGYMLVKFVGARQGIVLSGMLGGLVSSTAVTLTSAQRSHTQPALGAAYAASVVAAWIVMFGRVLVEVAVINPALLSYVWLPLSVAGGGGLLYALLLFLRNRSSAEVSDLTVSNPFELRPAVQFALLYAAILLIVNIARSYFGDAGLYYSSLLSGLVDVDAITLSMADLSRPGGSLDMTTAARAIVLAAMSNTFVKGAIIIVVGSNTLRRHTLPAVLVMLTLGLSVAFL